MKSRLKSWFEIGSVIVGGFLAYGGWQLSLHWLFNLGLATVALGVIGFGVKAIRSRSDTYSVGDYGAQSQSYSGFTAMMSGLFLAMIGMAILAYALISLLGYQEGFLSFSRSRPGIILLFAGVAAAVFSFTLILGSQEDRASPLAFLGSLPGRFFGILLLLLGIGLILLGGLEILSPAGFDALMESLSPRFPEFPE